MRILVIADIHGNLPALEAVMTSIEYDELFVIGDIVGYGPYPKECLARLMGAFDIDVQGDHDRALADGVAPTSSGAYERMAAETMAWTREQQIMKWAYDYVGAMPKQSSYEIKSVRYRCFHASPDDPVGGVIDWKVTEEDLIALLARYEESVIITAHTHVAEVRQVGEKLLVNPGSVGQPRDGNPEASCALITDGVPAIVRVPYDVEETVAALERMDTVSEHVKAQLAQVLGTARDPE